MASATRTTLQNSYNELLTQITQLAGDASFNGVNLLDGDSLSVTFNEDGSSSLNIGGVTFDAAGLGLNAITGDGFQVDANINAAITALDTATTSLRTQASAFGSKLSIVQGRQDPIDPEMAAEARDAIPGAKLVLLERAGHFSWIENPTAFTAALAEFLKTLP